ncbi:MAG: RsmE family RNA methyltransferase [Patescibacteria group bacterium]
MRLHKFFVKADLGEKSVFVENEELVKQIKNVLRLKVGDEVILSDGRLNEAVAKITTLNTKSFSAFVLDTRTNVNESKNHTVLYLSILKRENFEIAVQKATEVGIKEIIPIVSKRTVKLGLKTDRLEKIIQEAAEQSNRGIIPRLHETIELEKAIVEAKQNNLNIFFHPVGGPLPPTKDKNRIGIFIGPEGGWDESEILLAKNYNFVLAKMSPLSFRAETAAVVASYIVNQN